MVMQAYEMFLCDFSMQTASALVLSYFYFPEHCILEFVCLLSQDINEHHQLSVLNFNFLFMIYLLALVTIIVGILPNTEKGSLEFFFSYR